MDYHSFDDPSLIRLIAHAQEEALSELYDRYHRLVYSLAFHALQDPGSAEEITQDVFLRIWDHAASYQSEKAQVVTWIASMTRYRAIDRLRRRNVRPEGHHLPWDLATSSQEKDPLNVEQEVERAQRRDHVRQALAHLPQEQRQALAYAYFHGYTHRQIAERLDEPLGTIKTRIRLAMHKLRQLLEEEEDPHG